jgi:hypothetical protein
VWFMERSQQEERVARNQSLFGAISERVEELNETFVQVTPYGSWICECADTTCQERIQMTRREYEALREYPARFAVLPDASHVVPQVERVVERADHYWVVEKIGGASAEAAELTEWSESEAVAGGGSPGLMGNGVFELRFSNQASAATAARDARGRRFEVTVHQLGRHWRTFNRLVYDFPNDEQDRYASRLRRIAQDNGGTYVAFTPDTEL